MSEGATLLPRGSADSNLSSSALTLHIQQNKDDKLWLFFYSLLEVWLNCTARHICKVNNLVGFWRSQCEPIISVKIINNSPVPRMPLCLHCVLSIPHPQTPMNVLPVTKGLISLSRTLYELNPTIMFFEGSGMWETWLWPTHRADFLWDSPTLLHGITNSCVLTVYLHIPVCCHHRWNRCRWSCTGRIVNGSISLGKLTGR